MIEDGDEIRKSCDVPHPPIDLTDLTSLGHHQEQVDLTFLKELTSRGD
jgi:hypothetical protein